MEIKKLNLDSFIVKEEELDEALLAEVIDPYIERILSNGEVDYKKGFAKLSAARKILVEMLVKKVKAIKEIAGIKSEKISQKELLNKKDELGLNEENIKKSFNRELKKIIKREEGEYFVPNYNLQKAKEYLEIWKKK